MRRRTFLIGAGITGLFGIVIPVGADKLAEAAARYIMPKPQYSQSDINILAKTLFGEARGESEEEKIAVAQVVLNRVKDKRWPNTLEEVILQPKQFSCFNANDLNQPKVQNPEKYESGAWKECLRISRNVLDGKYKDISQGANHYCTNNPCWAKNQTPLLTIGKTKFFKL